MKKRNSWYKCVSEIFDYFGINRITALNLKGCLKKYVNKHLHLKYKELWKNNLFNDNKKLNCSNKLKTYRLFKKIILLLNHIYIGEIMTRDV